MALGGNFGAIDEAALQSLRANGVTESPTLEFKRDLYGNTDDAKKEFLKDLSALANTLGGHLVIGLDETDGVAGEIAPIVGDRDGDVLRLENLARDSIHPRIIGLKIRAVSVTGGYVIIIRVPKSLHAPHRVSFKGSNRFYGRNGGGAYELSVEELREAFTASSSAIDRARSFHHERVMLIDADAGIQAIARGTGILVLHLLPLASFGGMTAVDVDQRLNAGGLSPIGSSGALAPRLNFEGFVAQELPGPTGSGYTQLFRNGAIEATSAYVVMPVEGRNWVEAPDIEKKLVEALPRFLATLGRLEVPAPVSVFLTILDAEGAYVAMGRNPIGYRMGPPPPLRHHRLELPTVMVDDLEDLPSTRKLLRPMFDALYNAAGVSRAKMFDENGEWVGGQPE